MDAASFAEKWRRSTRSEKSASQEHFFDLCELFGQAKPGDVDPTGKTFSAERMVTKADGGRGYADFFKKDHFAWEYKRKGADLNEAFNQLLQYSGDLGNPPLLVASDMARIEVRTRFTGFPTTAFVIPIDDFTRPQNLVTLRRVFFEPEALRPEKTIETITKEAAAQLAEIAPGIRARHDDPARVAHFLDRLIFCLFAEDIGLLPNKLFSRIVEKYQTRDPRRMMLDVGQLFQAMAQGGDCYGETVPHINGNLFDDTPTLELTGLEFEVIHRAAGLDWSQMDPSIFGTLFERVMDPDQRAQLGAHYTGFKDIATLVEPVVMDPLRREWKACQAAIEALTPDPASRASADALIAAFLKRLRAVRVLDPACGSGNFLYVTLRMLKDLEYAVLVFCRHHELTTFGLEVGPHQLLGIEKNPYAFDLAQMTVWIGLLQWHRDNGFPYLREPVLQRLDTFENKDAILDLTDPRFPLEPDWPRAEFIVGNPPFLGYSRLRGELGHEYVEALFDMYKGRLSNQSDLCCYWFEKSRVAIGERNSLRAGLLATQSIRGGKNREVLAAIKRSGGIFFGLSDRNWILDGASVHVSMIGFDDSSEKLSCLDGKDVLSINSNLTCNADVTGARRLSQNLGIGFVGGFKFGAFDIDDATAQRLLRTPNLHSVPNSQVLRPWINGLDVLRRRSPMWIVDFGVRTPLEEAALFDSPFALILDRVKPERDEMRRQGRRERWWIHGEAAGNLRAGLFGLPRFIVTPRVSKHRIFSWIEPHTLIDGQLIAFARSDDYFFGILHSRTHEVWARSQGTQVRERESGFRYTPTSCFETFPFPEPTPAQHKTISEAAKRLDELRSNWLNPDEWLREEVLEFPGSVDGPWTRFVVNPDARGVGTVRYPRRVAKDAFVYDLAKRTLTNLYNERPTWLDLAHRALDEAVFAAYGWSPSMTDDELLSALLDLNLERSASGGGDAPTRDIGEETEEG